MNSQIKFINLRKIVTIVLGGSLLLLITLLAYKGRAFAEDKLQVLSSIIEVQNPTVSSEKLSWTYSEKLDEARKILAKTTPTVGTQEYTFSESRFLMSNGQLKMIQREFKEPELDIPLAVMEKATGKIRVVTITMKNGSIISPTDFPVNIEFRSNGIGWNWWNTQYQIPKGYVVLMNNYPVVDYVNISKKVTDKRGRKRTVVEKQPYLANSFLYAPYSKSLHMPELVEAGRAYIQQNVRQAFTELRLRGAKSRAFPGKLVADVTELHPKYFERLPIVEQSDMTEFILNPQRTSERVLVLLGANKEQTFTQTKSKAGATGWMQFTPGTYSGMRRLYPEAQLIADFAAGAPNHLNSMMAAILLHDNSLKGLMDDFGPSIAQDQALEEYLAAAYNGAPKYAHRSITAFLTLGLSDWIESRHLKNETKGYMIKIRELKRLGFLSSSTQTKPAL